MIYDLLESVTVCGKEYAINSDFRVILDIIEVLNDPELEADERGFFTLGFFYPDFEEMEPEHCQEAIRQCFWFINGGKHDEEMGKKKPRLMDWEKDFPYIISPVNRVAGIEIREARNREGKKYYHWWSFLSNYMEIGECTFAQIVHIRDQQNKGKTLEKFDREWYRQNRDLVDLKVKITSAEEEVFKKWGGGSGA